MELQDIRTYADLQKFKRENRELTWNYDKDPKFCRREMFPFKVSIDLDYRRIASACWCNVNCKGRYSFNEGKDDSGIYFENAQDALLFKLTWC